MYKIFHIAPFSVEVVLLHYFRSRTSAHLCCVACLCGEIDI